jgi:hypothetical protein
MLIFPRDLVSWRREKPGNSFEGLRAGKSQEDDFGIHHGIVDTCTANETNDKPCPSINLVSTYTLYHKGCETRKACADCVAVTA